MRGNPVEAAEVEANIAEYLQKGEPIVAAEDTKFTFMSPIGQHDTLVFVIEDGKVEVIRDPNGPFPHTILSVECKDAKVQDWWGWGS